MSQDNPADETSTIDLAREAASRLLSGNTFKDWVAVGRGVGVVRTRAMLAAKTNEPRGSKYAKAFDAELTNAGLEKIAGDKAARWRLLKIMEHLEEVEAWLQTVPSNKRLEYNHPTTVWRRFSETIPKQPRVSRIAEQQQAVAALEEQVARLTAENKALKSNSPKVEPIRLVEDLARHYSEPELRLICDLLSKQIDDGAIKKKGRQQRA